MKVATIDYETLGIEGRPSYPPPPVGVSIKIDGKPSRYYAFGHPEGNNCTWGEAREALRRVWESKCALLCHNAKYDLDVAEVHMDLPLPDWRRVEDTMLLLFLDDPHQTEMGLKPSAERLLQLPSDEQDAVADWLCTNQPIAGVKISRSKRSEHSFGRYIAYAPGDVVGPYACGDTDRTYDLWKLLRQRVAEREMNQAYDRERRLLLILLETERRGLPVDLKRLRSDVVIYQGWLAKINDWVLRCLNIHEEGVVNLDSGEQLVEAMVAAGKADASKLPRTPTGKYQTNKEALLLGVTDPQLLAMLKYRTQLQTCLRTFMEPWLLTAERSLATGVARIFTQWNQIRSGGDKQQTGARTGRLSSTPNFQNVPKEFKPIFWSEQTTHLVRCPLKGLPPLPKVREYILAFPGEKLCGRDFSSQELRMLAHFEGGPMQEAYIANPNLDLHQYAADLITSTLGLKISRTDAKTIAFSILYGSGVGKLAQSLGCTVEEASQLRRVYLNTFPGVKEILADMKERARSNQPIRTVGGREYFCEKPKLVEGRMREYDYKMINYLCQGSSADQTKDAIIRFASMKDQAKLLLSVHDEILISTPAKVWKRSMTTLRDCMNAAGLDVPMTSDGEVGASWGRMEPCEI